MTRFWLMLALILACVPAVSAMPPLVVILLPGSSLRDWQTADAPVLHRLMRSGALALMNTRTARLPSDHVRETPESAALTLGAGARAAGGPSTAFLPAGGFLPGRGITAGALYARRLGKPPPPGSSVNLSWPAIERANKRLGYQLRLGNLADALASRSVQVVCGGGPLSALVAATSNGTIRRSGTMTAGDGECLVWDAGPDVAAADPLLKRAAATAASRQGQLIVLSPFAGDSAFAQGRRLAPVLEWGPGVPAGLLLSPSTHRVGLVTNTDFAPTLGAWYGLGRVDFPDLPFGFAWRAVSADAAERQAAMLEAEAVRQSAGMKTLPYLAVGLAAWVLGGTALALRRRVRGAWPVVPTALLAAMLFSNSFAQLAGLFLVLMGAAWLLAARYGPHPAIVSLLAIVAVSLLLDMTTGNRLMHRGLLGYSAIEGARYYGIGNEAMGALVGASLVVTARLWRMSRARLLLLLFLGMVILLLGSVGAKAGGLLVSLAAFGTLGFSLVGGRWTARVALTLAALVIGAMAVAAFGDAVWSRGAHSHIGEAVNRIQSGGILQAADIVTRKLAVESRLAYHSAWACLLWGGLLCLALLWRATPPKTAEDRALRTAGLVAVAACVLLNDAGVVAGAICLVPLWCDAVSVWAGDHKKPLGLRRQPQGQ